MADRLVFVELVPGDASPGDDEALTARRARTPPAWFVRGVAHLRSGVVLAVLVGALLAADQAVRRAPAPPAPSTQTAGYVYADRGRCLPVAVSCQIVGRPRQDMWASYNALFGNTRSEGGSVWYDPNGGVVYFQELDAVGAAGQVITLTQQRLIGRPDVSFGPTIDITPDPRHGGPGIGRHGVIVTSRRGPWLITASLAGSRAAPLPVDAAVHWAAVVPLPG